MINTEDTRIEAIVLHKVGNKSAGDGLHLSKEVLHTDEAIRQVLLHYFITPFKTEEYYHFYHDSGLHMNEVYSFVSSIFDEPETFLDQSIDVAKHLYDMSTHPKIKSGEFYVVYFKDLILDGELIDAIGLFKSETKETYLKVYPSGGGYEIESDDGININKLDKGCLIFNTEADDGYLVAAVDNLNRNADARFWFDDFLQIRQKEDAYFQTENAITMCKSFVAQKLPEEFQLDRPDQAEMLNDSATYFKENEIFDLNDYAQQVIRQPEVIESFRDYKNEFEENNDLELADSFDISQPAVKKKSRFFKSVIKLDKNFHIYIHGKREYVRKGVDQETGLSYYQLLFESEA
ncbi:MAG: nucleoid-associated protein [Bacteroidales bacterium]|nr:nucleoid-associated protein [Bacteroidales bacterium]